MEFNVHEPTTHATSPSRFDTFAQVEQPTPPPIAPSGQQPAVLSPLHAPQLNETRRVYTYSPPGLIEKPLSRAVSLAVLHDGQYFLPQD